MLNMKPDFLPTVCDVLPTISSITAFALCHVLGHINTDQSLHTPNSVTHAPFNLPPTHSPHKHTHTRTHPHTHTEWLLFFCSYCACPVADLSLHSVIVASVARTDRPTGDWRWHAPIISGPSAVFAITESSVEHTESNSGVSIQKPFQLQMAAQLLLTTASLGWVSLNLRKRLLIEFGQNSKAPHACSLLKPKYDTNWGSRFSQVSLPGFSLSAPVSPRSSKNIHIRWTENVTFPIQWCYRVCDCPAKTDNTCGMHYWPLCPTEPFGCKIAEIEWQKLFLLMSNDNK